MPLMSAVVSIFCPTAMLIFLSFLLGCNGATAVLASFGLGLTASCILSVFNSEALLRPFGPLIVFLMLRNFLSHCSVPDGLYFQLWYLDDGILVGTPSALSSFLDNLQLQIPFNGLHPNLSKCEVFWPSDDKSFTDFPPAVKHVVFPLVGSINFLGSSIWGSPEFLSGSVVDRVSNIQEHLQELEDPQVELHLLLSCLGVYELSHLLWTILSGCVDS